MQQRPSGHSPRGRPAAPDPSPLPPSSPPPPHRHIFPDAQAPLPPPPLPSALVPPKKRRVLRPPRKAATPIPPPPPPPTPTPALAAPVPAAGMLAVSDPSPLPPVDGSGVLTPPCTGAEDEEPFATARPVPDADAELSSVPPPAPDATAKPARVRRVRKVIRKVIVKKVVPKGTLAARKAAAAAAAAYGASKSGGETPADKPANDHGAATGKSVGKEQGANEAVVAKPVTNRNAIAAPAAAAGALTSRGETPTDKPTNDQDAATGESVGQEQHRDETVVQKLATDCTIIAAPTAAGALKSRGEISTEKLTNDQDAAADKLAGKEQDVNETIVEKPATNCNAVAVRGSLGKETAAEGLAGKTLARKPVIDCNARGGDGVGMSERQRTRMKEVFVGGLDRDAKEEDVRAVFAKVGDITQVRMIMDVHTRKNKGYCFVRYCEAAQAKKAIAKFGKVKEFAMFKSSAPLEENEPWKKPGFFEGAGSSGAASAAKDSAPSNDTDSLKRKTPSAPLSDDQSVVKRAKTTNGVGSSSSTGRPSGTISPTMPTSLPRSSRSKKSEIPKGKPSAQGSSRGGSKRRTTPPPPTPPQGVSNSAPTPSTKPDDAPTAPPSSGEPPAPASAPQLEEPPADTPAPAATGRAESSPATKEIARTSSSFQPFQLCQNDPSTSSEPVWEVEDAAEANELEEAMKAVAAFEGELPEALKTMRKSMEALRGTANLVNLHLAPLTKLAKRSRDKIEFLHGQLTVAWRSQRRKEDWDELTGQLSAVQNAATEKEAQVKVPGGLPPTRSHSDQSCQGRGQQAEERAGSNRRA